MNQTDEIFKKKTVMMSTAEWGEQWGLCSVNGARTTATLGRV